MIFQFTSEVSCCLMEMDEFAKLVTDKSSSYMYENCFSIVKDFNQLTFAIVVLQHYCGSLDLVDVHTQSARRRGFYYL